MNKTKLTNYVKQWNMKYKHMHKIRVFCNDFFCVLNFRWNLPFVTGVGVVVVVTVVVEVVVVSAAVLAVVFIVVVSVVVVGIVAVVGLVLTTVVVLVVVGSVANEQQV